MKGIEPLCEGLKSRHTRQRHPQTKQMIELHSFLCSSFLLKDVKMFRFNVKFNLEINMNNWIDEEADKYRAEKELEEKKENAILMSDYWTEVKVQITKDVEQINNNEIWKKALRDVPLEITTSTGKYEISKEFFPEVTITVEKKDDEIEITKAIKRTTESKKSFNTETLKLISDGGKVYLQGGTHTFSIPEETARHILTPIIDALSDRL